MSGLTEPLFALLAVLSVVLVLNNRWSLALAIASFLPYSRPEHVALIPFMVGFTLLHRKWRALPWIALGTLVYAIASAIVFHDPLKVLLSDPYTGVDVYGTGPAMHFVDRMDEIIGVPLKWATLFAVICWPVLWWKDRERRSVHLGVLLLTLLPALAILCIHSYAWWKGGHGSLGLLRVLATGVPLLVLFVAQVIASLWELFVPERGGWKIVGALVLVAYGSFAYADFRVQLLLPFPEDPVQRTELLAAPVIKEKLTGDTRLYMLDPYLLALCDVDPWNSDRVRMLYGMGSLAKGGSIRPGDLVVWDGHFCQNEGGVPLDSLLLGDRFEPLVKFAPEEKPIMLGGMAYEIDLFRYAPAEHLWTRDTLFVLGDPRHFPFIDRIDTVPSPERSGQLTISADQYPIGFKVLPVGMDPATSYEDLIIRGELRSDVPTKQEVLFVFTESEGEKQVSYLKKSLSKGAFEWRVQVLAGLSHRTNKLYLWNRTGRPVDFARLEVIHERVRHSVK
jgi:hypothetical protein